MNPRRKSQIDHGSFLEVSLYGFSQPDRSVHAKMVIFQIVQRGVKIMKFSYKIKELKCQIW